MTVINNFFYQTFNCVHFADLSRQLVVIQENDGIIVSVIVICCSVIKVVLKLVTLSHLLCLWLCRQ